MTKFKATKIALVSAIALLSTFSIFANNSNSTLYYKGTNGNIQSMWWGFCYEGVEYNNQVFKFATVNPSGPKYNNYIVISSAYAGGSPTDPVLYFGNDVLADDYNGTLDFKVVIHFNGCQWMYGMPLGYSRYDGSYPNGYYVYHEVSESDPGLHRLYYLEVYPNYTTQKIWHP